MWEQLKDNYFEGNNQDNRSHMQKSYVDLGER